MPKERHEKLIRYKALSKSLIKGLSAGVVVFLFGFLPMNFLWAQYLAEAPNLSLPGLYDYRAATWGDGLFLPIAAVGLVACISYIRCRLTTRQRAIVVFCGIIGVAFGALLQISWLANPNIRLNWTIPEVGYFNLAGWYHAFFLSMAIGFYAVCLALFFFKLKAAISQNSVVSASILQMLIWTGLFGFLAMLILDDYSSSISYYFLSLLLCAFSLAFCAVFYRVTASFEVFRTQNKFYFFYSALPSVCLTIGVLIQFGNGFASLYENGVMFVSLVCMMLVLFSIGKKISVNTIAIKGLSCLLFSIGISLLVLNLSYEIKSLSSNRSAESIFILLFLVVVFFIFYCLTVYLFNEKCFEDFRKCRFAILLALLAMIASFLICVGQETVQSFLLVHFTDAIGSSLFLGFSDVLEEVVYVALLLAYVLVARETVKSIGEIERKNVVTVRNLAVVQAVNYSFLLIVAIGIILLIVFYSLSLGSNAASEFIGDPNFLFVALFGFGCSLLAISRKLRNIPIKLIVLVCILIGIYGLLIISLTSFRQPYIISPFQLIAIFPCIGSALLVGESFLSNCCFLRGARMTIVHFISGVFISVGCFLVTVVSILPTYGEEGEVAPVLISSLVGVLGIVFAYVLIPTLCAFSLYRTPEKKLHFIKNSAISGIFQNGFAATAAVSFFGVIFLGITGLAPLDSGITFVLFAVLSILSHLLFPLQLNRKNLQHHVYLYEEYFKPSSSVAWELRSEALHFQRQAIISAFLAMPWTVIHFLSRAFIGQEVKFQAWSQLLLRLNTRDALVLFYGLLPYPRPFVIRKLRRLANEALDVVS